MPSPSSMRCSVRSPSLLLVALLLLPLAASAQWEDVTIEATPLAGNIHLLTGRGGNMAVCVGEDGTFLVDDQFAPLTAKIRAAIEGLDGGPIRFVLNTHWHGDHTGGNENLGETGSVIVAHDNVRERMSTDEISELWDRTTPASPAGALPVVTFPSAVRFHLNGETIHAFHVQNAHTDGDAIVHFESADVLHMGDVWFHGSYPFLDVDSGGSLQGVISAVETVLAMAGPETVIVPGHGDPGTREDLAACRKTLMAIRDAVQAAIDQHGTLEAVAAADPLAAWNDELGGGFINPETMLRLVYLSLTR